MHRHSTASALSARPTPNNASLLSRRCTCISPLDRICPERTEHIDIYVTYGATTYQRFAIGLEVAPDLRLRDFQIALAVLRSNSACIASCKAP